MERAITSDLCEFFDSFSDGVLILYLFLKDWLWIILHLQGRHKTIDVGGGGGGVSHLLYVYSSH